MKLLINKYINNFRVNLVRRVEPCKQSVSSYQICSYCDYTNFLVNCNKAYHVHNNKWLNWQIQSATKIIHVNTINIYTHSLFIFQISMQYVLCLVIKPSVLRYNYPRRENNNYLIRISRSKHDYIMIINKIKSVIENHLLCSCFLMQTCQWGWLNIMKVWPWLQPLMI